MLNLFEGACKDLSGTVVKVSIYLGSVDVSNE